MPLSTFDETKDPSLPWQRNSIPSTLLERARFVVLFTAVPWSFPAIGWYLSNPHTQNMYLIFGLVATFSAFLSVTVLTMSILGRIRPSAMAVTKEGIHFWYSRPADRYEMEPLIPWSEVTEVKQVVLNRSRQLVLVKSSGGTTSLGWPSAGTRDAIQKAWSDRASNSLHRD